MSEMSKSQGPASGGMDLNPTDDMVPPGARDPDSPGNRSEFDGSEDVLPQDYGSDDVAPQESEGVQDTPDPTAVPPSLNRESGGEESAPAAESSSDPMPDIAGQGGGSGL